MRTESKIYRSNPSVVCQNRERKSGEGKEREKEQEEEDEEEEGDVRGGSDAAQTEE